ncbi:MAG TPA: hypothetical protein VIT21_13285 [Chthoniobacterales bacterium]
MIDRRRRLDETAEIVIFDRGPYISFANCGLPYFVGGVIENEEEPNPVFAKRIGRNFPCQDLLIRARRQHNDHMAKSSRLLSLAMMDLTSV